MPYGHATRAISSPIASGQRGRLSVPKRYLPLSQFFLQQDKPVKGEKVIYGRKEPEKKKAQEKPQKEGMTTTANVPTVPVPIGAGDGRRFLDRPGERKKKKKKDLSARMGLLLRRLF